jgi:hypothetical protein
MKTTLYSAAALVIAGALTMQAQATSTTRIPVHKDTYPATTSSGTYVAPDTLVTTTMPVDTTALWYVPAGATTCSSVDANAARAVAIKTDLYNPSAGMISPDSAKIIALCAVPGQIGSGEMNVSSGVTEYAIDIIPNRKKTHTKVIVDANTGAVLSTKQFGGARGFVGWIRESKEHRQNAKTPKDSMPQL